MRIECLVVICILLCSCTVTSSGGHTKVDGPLDILSRQAKSVSDTFKDVSGDLSEVTKNDSGAKPEDFYPKATDDASIIYVLESNMERTDFYIDAKKMGKARRLKVKINNHEHIVVAKPEDCMCKKEEVIRPPYNSHAPLRFTFLIGECGKSRPTTKAEVCR